MNLIPNWREVLSKAWSVRFIVLATILSGLEVVLGIVDLGIPRGLFASVAGLVSAGALLARVLLQQNMESENAD